MARSIVFSLLFVFSTLANAATVLVLGDSLSAGYGLRTEEAWPAHLQRKLQTLPGEHRVVNASISGETTAGGRSRLPQALTIHSPDILVIELGANDGLRGLPLASMEANLLAMIDAAQAANVAVVLLGMQLPPNYGSNYADKFREVFAGVAEARDVPLVPFLLEGFAADREMFQNDGIHPTAAAQPRILENIWPTLAPLIGTAQATR